MSKKTQNMVEFSNSTYSYNNIDIDLSLSFNNLTYTLSYENSKKYLTSNSLLFNIEDEDTIYNIFKHNDIQFTYQLNNILFIDNEQNMHVLNYNLRTQNNFSINDNNQITFNVLNNSLNENFEFNNQTSFSYNSNNFSYIYSNEKELNSIKDNNIGLFCIDNDNILLNSNNNLTININKFNYNYLHITNMVNKNNYILNNYSYNINLFGYTPKYKNYIYTNNLSFIEDYTNYNINITTSNQNYKLKYKPNLDFIIKDTNYFVIDLPIEYKYDTIVYKNFQFNRILCPINIDNLDINITSKNNDITKYININKSKSFIHNNKSLSIEYYINEKNKYEYTPSINEHCNISLYFDVNKQLYEEIYNNPINNQIIITIKYKNITYNFICYIDIMHNQFKKLYHNYNYGFNFDNHGEAIGILLLEKNLNRVENLSLKFKPFNETNINIENISSYPITKNIFVNYNSKSINNIFVKINNYNFTNQNRFNKIIYYNNEQVIDNVENIINNLQYPSKLKCKNLTLIYKDNNVIQNKINLLQQYNNISDQNLLLFNVYLTDKNINLYQYNNQNVVNNPFICDKETHKNIFNDIYNYRKSGLLRGDYYTPCVLDYMLIYLFEIEKYFDYDIYQSYIKQFCTLNKDTNNLNIYQYRLLTNQFNKTLNGVHQYAINLTKKPNTILNDENFDPNKFYIDFISKNQINEDNYNKLNHNYIWPLFRIPDYSIINSNDYIIVYNEDENCEYIDYYTNLNKNKYFNINFRSYHTGKEGNSSKTNPFNFIIADEKYNLINYIQITNTYLIDNENDIYQITLYIKSPLKVNIIYILFEDSEEYMNNINISDKKYRILCKIYLKNKDN